MLGRYRFRDVPQAYKNLMALSTGEDPLSVDAPLPAFSGVDRAAIAARPSPPRPTPTSTLVNLEQGQRLAGRQGGAVGTVQLQSALDAAVRRAVLVQPVPVGHSDQQPGHDRRADGQPGARTSCRRCESAAQHAGRAGPRRRGPGADPAQLQEHAAVARRRARHPGQGRRFEATIGGAVGHRRDLPRSGSRRPNTKSWCAKWGEPTIGGGSSSGRTEPGDAVR